MPILPVAAWVAGIIGAAFATRWAIGEWQRVNAELDSIRRTPAAANAERLPKLKPDPVTGIYRPQA